MDVEIAPDGRVFVAEKSGIVKTFDEPLGHDADGRSPTCARRSTTSPAAGCSALAVDPDFPAKPYVYVYYTLDAPIGGTPPTFGTRRARRSDHVPGRHRRGQLRRVGARLARCGSSGETMTGPSRCWSTTGASSTRSTPAAGSSSAPTATCTSPAATAPAGRSGTTASSAIRRTPAATRPAAGRRADAHAADRGGRAAARAGPAHRAATRSASTAR